MFIYVKYRFGVKQLEKHETIDEIVKEANGDIEWNEACPDTVLDELGNAVLSHEQLLKKLTNTERTILPNYLIS